MSKAAKLNQAPSHVPETVYRHSIHCKQLKTGRLEGRTTVPPQKVPDRLLSIESSLEPLLHDSRAKVRSFSSLSAARVLLALLVPSQPQDVGEAERPNLIFPVGDEDDRHIRALREPPRRTQGRDSPCNPSSPFALSPRFHRKRVACPLSWLQAVETGG